MLLSEAENASRYATYCPRYTLHALMLYIQGGMEAPRTHMKGERSR